MMAILKRFLPKVRIGCNDDASVCLAINTGQLTSMMGERSVLFSQLPPLPPPPIPVTRVSYSGRGVVANLQCGGDRGGGGGGGGGEGEEATVKTKLISPPSPMSAARY